MYLRLLEILGMMLTPTGGVGLGEDKQVGVALLFLLFVSCDRRFDIDVALAIFQQLIFFFINLIIFSIILGVSICKNLLNSDWLKSCRTKRRITYEFY